MGQDLLGGLRGDLYVALWAVLHADFGVEQAQVMVYLGDRGHGRFTAATGDALLDGHRGWYAPHNVDLGSTQGLQELPRIGREAFHIAALPLGENDIEGERRLPRTAQPGDHDQLIARDVHLDVFQIMVAGATDTDGVMVGHHRHRGRVRVG